MITRSEAGEAQLRAVRGLQPGGAEGWTNKRINGRASFGAATQKAKKSS